MKKTTTTCDVHFHHRREGGEIVRAAQDRLGMGTNSLFTLHHAGGGRQSAAKSLNRALAWQGRAAGGRHPSWSGLYSVVPVLVMVRSRAVGWRRRVYVDGRGHGRGLSCSRPCRRGGYERAWLSVQAARLCVEVPWRDAAVRCCFLSAGLREEGRGRGGRRREWCSPQKTATN